MACNFNHQYLQFIQMTTTPISPENSKRARALCKNLLQCCKDLDIPDTATEEDFLNLVGDKVSEVINLATLLQQVEDLTKELHVIDGTLNRMPALSDYKERMSKIEVCCRSNQVLSDENHQLKTLNTELLKDKQRLRTIRGLMGYIQAGEGDTVRIFQDDVPPYTYNIIVGKQSYWGDTFNEVIDKAIQSTEKKV